MKTYLKLLFLIIFIIVPFNSFAQDLNERSKQLIEVSNKIRVYYIFDDIAIKLSSKLKSEIQKKTFDNLTDKEFADSLTSYLANNGNDLHFNVLLQPGPKKEKEAPLDVKEILKRYDAINRQRNYGFEKVQRLEGNVGYIQYTGFPPENKTAKETLAATMNFVANTNALILDLRDNNGGDSETTATFLSYFFEKRTKLSQSYTRYKDKYESTFTKKKVDGRKYLNKPIYILVGPKTISAAEALAYYLQQNNKAIVIGEKTYGAANPVEVFSIDNLFHLFIPVTESKEINSQENWEHKGVHLDEYIEVDKALFKAQLLVLEKLLKDNVKTELTKEELHEIIKNLKTKF